MRSMQDSNVHTQAYAGTHIDAKGSGESGSALIQVATCGRCIPTPAIYMSRDEQTISI